MPPPRGSNGQAQPGDVILADWDASNYLAPRTPARVYGGHPVATLQAADKQFATRTVFAPTTSSLLVAQRSSASQWLVYGPDEEEPGRPSRTRRSNRGRCASIASTPG